MVIPELERLLNDLVPFAEQGLVTGGGFATFGGSITLDEEIQHISVETDDGAGPPEDAVETLVASFRDGAEQGTYLAVAIFADVSLLSEESDDSTDAIQVHLEHVSGACVHIYIPYRESADGGIEYGERIPENSTPVVFVG